MHFLKAIATACIVVAISSPISANQGTTDGTFEVYDADAIAFYKGLSAENRSVMDKATAEKLVQLMLADGTISRREIGQLNELRRTDVKQVSAVIEGNPMIIPTADEEGRAYLSILFDRVPLTTLWKGGPNELRRFVDMRRMGSGPAQAIENFVAAELNKIYEQSTLNNAYEPIRSELKTKHDKAASLPGDYPTQFDLLLYDSMIRLRTDPEFRNPQNLPPPFLYNWLNPDSD